ncbi:MAG: glycosyltransferase family 4 protein [Phycisphaeraceae bacterium]
MLAAAQPSVGDVLWPYAGVFVVALVGALLLSPVMRMLALRNGIIDWPNVQRKEHARPVAYLGGVAIFLGWLAGVAVSYAIEPHMHAIDGTGSAHVSFPIGIVVGAALVMFTGLFDDLYGVSPRVKVGGQLLAGAALASEHVGLELAESSLSLLHLPTGEAVVAAVGTVAIALFVMGGCNAMNLLDGLDGLASGVTAIGCLGLLVIAGIVAMRAQGGEAMGGSVALDDPVRLTLLLAALGAVLGFLPFNLNPARIFMGDAGSLLLGFLMVTAILLLGDVSGAGPRLVTAALLVFAVPIVDTTLAILRRTMRGQAFFHADSEHLHHMLCRAGLSVWQSVAVLYGAAVGFAVLGCTLVALDLRWRYVMAVCVAVFVLAVLAAYKWSRRQWMPGRPAPDAAPAAAGQTGQGLHLPPQREGKAEVGSSGK